MSDQKILTRGDLSKHPKEVADVLLQAVNTYGVPYRLLDGSHIRLYNGDREVVPFKASASRPERYTLQYLHRWLEENWQPWAEQVPEQEKVTQESLQALAEKYPGPDDDDDDTNNEPESEEQVEPEMEPEWVPYRSPRGETYGFETNGKIYRCAWCGYRKRNAQGMHLHAASHDDRDLWKRSAAAKARYRAERESNAEQKRIYLQQALSALVEHHGYAIIDPEHVPDPEEVTATAQKIEDLQAEVSRLIIERDEALARLSLVKEAFKA